MGANLDLDDVAADHPLAMKELAGLRDEITRLRDWIRRESEITDTCVFHVLGEICPGCRCSRQDAMLAEREKE